VFLESKQLSSSRIKFRAFLLWASCATAAANQQFEVTATTDAPVVLSGFDTTQTGTLTPGATRDTADWKSALRSHGGGARPFGQSLDVRCSQRFMEMENGA